MSTAGADSSSSSRSRQKREHLRYAEAIFLSNAASGDTVSSSTDTALTAYAQLVALRLNVRRVLISIVDEDHQYIIAEATRTLSLQKDNVYEQGDALHFGTCVVPRQADFTASTLESHEKFIRGEVPHASFVVPDLLQNGCFESHVVVREKPHARSYGGVPLVTPNGHAVGTLAFLHDIARPAGVIGTHLQFLQDIAGAVINHLELSRTAIIHTRGQRLVRGLTRFVEGKESLQENVDHTIEHVADSTNAQATSRGKYDSSSRTSAMQRATDSERAENYRIQHSIGPATSISKVHGAQSANLGHHTIRRQRRAEYETDTLTHNDSTGRGAEERQDERANTSSANASGQETAIERPLNADDVQESPKEEFNATGDTRPKKTSKQPPTASGSKSSDDTLVAKNAQEAFQRAAKILIEALDADGALILDATTDHGRHLHRSGSYSDSSPEESDAIVTSGNETESRSVNARTGSDEDENQRPVCSQLASAYNVEQVSSRRSGVLHKGIPQAFFKSLLRRHPYGKIFNFDSAGTTSSDDSSGNGGSHGLEHAEASQTSKHGGNDDSIKRRRRPLKRDGALVREMFPGVRAFAVMPMYDNSRERFYAAAMVWSNNNGRVFSHLEDLSYIGAFCDVVMAEVGRLEAQREAQIKTSFLSSISHELKTPLHGILGGLEYLSGVEEISTQREMLHMVESSGRSLLDIVNHLLDHAESIASRRRAVGNSKGLHAASNINKRLRDRRPLPSPPLATTDVAALTEDVIDAAFMFTPKPTPRAPVFNDRVAAPESAPLKAVLNIDLTNTGLDWTFLINPGAWRRILQNLLNNAIKYTDFGGYLQLSLSKHDPGPEIDSKVSLIELVCIDTGRGMSKEYLRSGLWKPFSQEDAHSQGTGLGLSLVREMIHDMGGSINVQSNKDIGTAIKIVVPLERPADWISSRTADHLLSEKLKARLEQCSYALIGFDDAEDKTGRATQTKQALRTSIVQVCDFSGMHATEPGRPADICIISEERASTMTVEEYHKETTNDAGMAHVILLCHSISSSRDLAAAQAPVTNNAIKIAQPLGPRKLMKALASCFDYDGHVTAAGSDKRRRSSPPAESVRTRPRSSEVASPAAQDPDLSPYALVTDSTTSGGDVAGSRGVHGFDLRLLLVDDNHLNLTLLEAFAKKIPSVTQTSASNGQEAVDAYFTAGIERFQLILMDITMPIMDGFEATRRIRKFESEHNITPPAKIVALTAMASSEARQEAASSGIDLFLTKPVKLTQLRGLVRSMQDRSDGRGQARMLSDE